MQRSLVLLLLLLLLLLMMMMMMMMLLLLLLVATGQDYLLHCSVTAATEDLSLLRLLVREAA